MKRLLRISFDLSLLSFIPIILWFLLGIIVVFSDFCFIENISEFRYITTSFSGIKQLQNALCPFLKYFVFRSLGYTRNAHHLILIRHTKFNRIC